MAMTVISRKQDPDVVTFLEDALGRARAGEISGILLVEQRSTSSTWSAAGIQDRFRLVGYLFYALVNLQGMP